MHARHSQPWVGLSLKAQLDAASAVVQHHHLVAALGRLHRRSLTGLQLLLLLPPLPLGQLHNFYHTAARACSDTKPLHTLLLQLPLLLLGLEPLLDKAAPAVTAVNCRGRALKTFSY